jgi:hypothetical protein
VTTGRATSARGAGTSSAHRQRSGYIFGRVYPVFPVSFSDWAHEKLNSRRRVPSVPSVPSIDENFSDDHAPARLRPLFGVGTCAEWAHEKSLCRRHIPTVPTVPTSSIIYGSDVCIISLARALGTWAHCKAPASPCQAACAPHAASPMRSIRPRRTRCYRPRTDAPRGRPRDGTMELATTTRAPRAARAKDKHDRVITVSDLNDTWPHDDPDVIALSKNKEVARVPAALAPIDLTRVAANIMRVADADRDRGVDGAALNDAAPASSGSRDLAAMVMFDLDRETLRSVTVTIGCKGTAT